MKRGWRITLEMLGPPLAGSLPVAILFGIGDGVNRGWLQGLKTTATLVGVVGYGFGILPSLAYMLAMETAFAKGLDPAGDRMIGWSGLLGLLAGFALGVAWAIGTGDGLILLTLACGGWGLMVGLVHGVIIRMLSRRRSG